MHALWSVFVTLLFVFFIGYIAGAGWEAGRNATWRALNKRGKSADPGSDREALH